MEEVDSSKLFEAAVESMLATLDPYTEYEGEQLAQDMREVREEKERREGREGRVYLSLHCMLVS